MKKRLQRFVGLLIGIAIALSLTAAAGAQDIEEQTVVTFEGHVYKLFGTIMTWIEAKEFCESLGGHLVTVTSSGENDFIKELILSSGQNMDKTGYWFGATDKDKNGDWKWLTGEPWGFTDFASGQPSGGSEEHYLGIVFPQMLWHDWNNDYYRDSNGFICEWDSLWTDAAGWAEDELQAAAEAGLIPETLVGEDFTKPVTRGEFAAVAVQLYETWTGKIAPVPTDCPFTDISGNANRIYILKAYGLGVTAGISSTVFDSAALITREQLVTMLCRVYKAKEWPNWTLSADDNFTLNYSGVEKFSDDADISDYAKPSVYFMVKYGVVSGIGNNLFAPKNTTPAQEASGYATATREQAVLMSLRSFESL